MNCCDDYGKCTQGRDCPARAKCKKETSLIAGILIDLVMAVAGAAIITTSIAYFMGVI